MRTSLVVGALIFLIGFIGYHIGTSLIPKESQIMIELLAGLLPKDIPTETLGLIFQFGGGVIAIIGLIICLNSMARPPVKIQPVEVPKVVTAVAERPRCKFCNSFLEGDSIFCPACGKSQKYLSISSVKPSSSVRSFYLG